MTLAAIGQAADRAGYYVLAFAVSWALILGIVGVGRLPRHDRDEPVVRSRGLRVDPGPSVGRHRHDGPRSTDGRACRELVARLLRWRVGARWYVVALLTAPIVTSLIPFALSVDLTVVPAAIITADDKAGLVVSGIAVGLTVSVFEELGWTGFVTPRLRLRHGVLGTGLLMGLLWGTWHLPLFAGSAASSGASRPWCSWPRCCSRGCRPTVC